MTFNAQTDPARPDYRLVLDRLANAVVAADETGCIVYANAATERLLGWPAGELIGQSLGTIQPPRLRDVHLVGFRRYLETRTPKLIGGTVRVPALRRDGTEVEVELALAAVRTDEGAGRELFVASLRDLSERIELERQITVTRYLRAAAGAAAKFSTGIDRDGVLQTTVDTLVVDFDAGLAQVWLSDGESDVLRLGASARRSTATIESADAQIDPVSPPRQVGEVARSRQPLVQNDLVGDPVLDQGWIEGEEIASVAAFPLVAGDDLLGVLVCFGRSPLPEEGAAALASFAAMVTAALNDVQLLVREQAARAEAEAGQRHAAFLAEASALLASSLDYEATLASVARAAVPHVADWCAIDVVEDDDRVRPLAIAHVDPAKVELARELRHRYPPDPDAPIGSRHVLRTGQSELVPEIRDAALVAAARDEEHLRVLRDVGFTSYMAVPLATRQRTLGVITLVSAESGRRYRLADLALAEELARRAALAIDNAQLYRDAREAEERARRQAVRLEVLARASQAFAAARLDLPAVLDTVARQTVEALGDGCIIRLVSDDGGWFIPAAAHYPNPEALSFLWGLLRATPHPIDEGLVGRVAASGEPLLLAAPSQAEMRAALKPEYRAFLDRFGLHSALIVPLRGRDGVIGTLMTWRDTAGRPYTLDDQGFLQALADRAASAIENARLYREQVEARGRVQQLAAERALTLGQIAEGVIITDAEGQITFVNDAARALHGVAELGVGVDGYTATYHLLTLEGEPYPPAELPLARAVLRGETVVDAEWRIRRPDGSEVVAQGSATPVVAEDGRRLGAVLTVRDVTAEREFQRQKDEFFITASHDLKTPLTSIKGWAQLLRARAERDGARVRDLPALSATEAQAGGMQRLVEQLLDASRLRIGQRLELEPTEFDLTTLARRLVGHYQAMTDRHELRVMTSDSGTVRGHWDEGRIEQVVANLLSNAIKYSPGGGRIEVTVARVEDEARLRVWDEGIGIPAAEQARVFEQFYRAENAAGADGGAGRGFGIGLFSAQQIAARHRGRIEAESVEGEGSTFTLVLPLEASALSAPLVQNAGPHSN